MTLEDDLLAVEGVTAVVVSLADSGPFGIQLEVGLDADRAAVVQQIGRVLDDRGLDAAFVPTAPRIDVVASPGRVSAASRDAGDRQGADPDTDRIAAVAHGVATVATSENDRGVELAVRLIDGSKGTKRCAADENTVWRALGELLYELAGPDGPRPLVETVEWLNVGGVPTVVVVVMAGDHRRLGAAEVKATRPLAVARAVWVALT